MSLLQEIKTSYSYKKIFEIQNRFTYAKKDKAMEKAVLRYDSCPDKKDDKTISYEMKALKEYWNCHPFQYIRYDLYRKDKNFTIEQLKDYVPEYFFYRLYLPYHSNKRFEVLADDKNILERYFRSLDIKHPMAIAKIYEGKIYNEKFLKIQPQEVLEKACEYEDIFVKPAGGKGGYGIQVFSKDNNKLVSKDGVIFSEDVLNTFVKAGDWILQPGIKQDVGLSEIYPHSINTFRIATENITGVPKMLFASLRMGRGGARIDNTSQGAIIANIDTETGNFIGGAVSKEMEIFESHPDTGFKFAEFKNKDWGKIKEFVLNAAGKMPQLAHLGWDIALSVEGPLAIETNRGFGIDGIQTTKGGLRKVLSIEDPMFYWKNARREG